MSMEYDNTKYLVNNGALYIRNNIWLIHGMKHYKDTVVNAGILITLLTLIWYNGGDNDNNVKMLFKGKIPGKKAERWVNAGTYFLKEFTLWWYKRQKNNVWFRLLLLINNKLNIGLFLFFKFDDFTMIYIIIWGLIFYFYQCHCAKNWNSLLLQTYHIPSLL